METTCTTFYYFVFPITFVRLITKLRDIIIINCLSLSILLYPTVDSYIILLHHRMLLYNQKHAQAALVEPCSIWLEKSQISKYRTCWLCVWATKKVKRHLQFLTLDGELRLAECELTFVYRHNVTVPLSLQHFHASIGVILQNVFSVGYFSLISKTIWNYESFQKIKYNGTN